MSTRRSPNGVRSGLRERLTFGSRAQSAVPARASVAAAAALAREPGPVHLTRISTWDWGWGGVLIFTLLLFFRPQDSVPLFATLHLSDTAAIVGLLAMVAVNISRREAMVRLTPEVVGVIAFALVVILTVPFSIWPGGAVGVFNTLVMQVTLIFVLMVNTITSPKRIDRICWVIVVAFGYVSARVTFDYLRGVNLVEGNRAAGPVGGFFENPNDLALNLVSFLPLAMTYVRRPGRTFTRLIAAVIVVLMCAALIFTKSRGGMVGAVAMIAVFLVAARLLTPPVILTGVMLGMVTVPAMPQSFWDRMASIVDASKDPTGSREERKELMKEALRVFEKYPLTGVGAGQFENYTEPGEISRWRVTHNTPLQVAAELGIAGLATFYFLVFRGFAAARWVRRASRIVRHRGRRDAPGEPEDGLDPAERHFFHLHGAAMVACLAGWFVSSLFASVAYNWTIYYLLGLSVCARGVMQARARAYTRAKQAGQTEVVAA